MSEETKPVENDAFEEHYQAALSSARQRELPPKLRLAWEEQRFTSETPAPSPGFRGVGGFWWKSAQGFALATMVCSLSLIVWWAKQPVSPTPSGHTQGQQPRFGSKQTPPPPTRPKQPMRSKQAKVLPRTPTKRAPLPTRRKVPKRRWVLSVRKVIVACVREAKRDVFRTPQQQKNRLLKKVMYKNLTLKVSLFAHLDQPQVMKCMRKLIKGVLRDYRARAYRETHLFMVETAPSLVVYHLDTQNNFTRNTQALLRRCLEFYSAKDGMRRGFHISLLLLKTGGYALTVIPFRPSVLPLPGAEKCLQSGFVALRYQGTPYFYKHTGRLIQAHRMFRWRATWLPWALPRFSLRLEKLVTSSRLSAVQY